MSLADAELPTDPDALRAFALALRAELAEEVRRREVAVAELAAARCQPTSETPPPCCLKAECYRAF